MSLPAARRAAALAALVTLGAAASARASLPLTLTWEAPTGCPTASDLRAEVERLVRFPPGQAPPPLAAEGHVESRDGRWHLQLRTERDGLPGERELEADSCASLAHAATLVLALAFGVGAPDVASPAPPPVEERPARPTPRPRVVEAPPPPAPPPPVEAPPPPVVPPRAEPVIVVAPAPPPRAPTQWWLTAGTRVSRGPLPDLDWGAGVGLDAMTGRLVVGARLDAWLPTDDAVTGTSARMQFSGVGGALSLCALAVRHARFALAGCALGGAAAVTGTSTGGLTSKSLTAPWYTAGAAVRARLRLVRALHAEALLEAAGSLTRPRFSLKDHGDVYTVPALVPAATLGLSVDL